MTGIHEDAIERLTADVAVVGYGPVGRLLALLLGRSGRGGGRGGAAAPKAYPLPRAVHFDDEIGRIFQSVGLPPDSATGHRRDPTTTLRMAIRGPRDTLLRLDWRGLGPSGWHVSNFFYQPSLEVHPRCSRWQAFWTRY